MAQNNYIKLTVVYKHSLSDRESFACYISPARKKLRILSKDERPVTTFWVFPFDSGSALDAHAALKLAQAKRHELRCSYPEIEESAFQLSVYHKRGAAKHMRGVPEIGDLEGERAGIVQQENALLGVKVS